MKKLILSLFLIVGTTSYMTSQSVVTFYTNMGDFEIELYDTLKPITAGNFLDLTNAEFYDNVIFHRVIANFIIQGGDPTGTGFGGPGYTIPDEFDASLSNVEKTISMANSGPDTGGSQFFINMVDNIYLDFDNPPLTSAHPVFGTVINGWEIVQMIQNVPVNSNNRPIDPVVMDSIRVTEPFLGITEYQQNDFAAIIYPNPVNNRSVIQLKNNSSAITKVSILSLSGAVISSKVIEIAQGVNRIPMVGLGTEELSSGMYFISVDNGRSMIQESFIIK